MLKKSPVHPQGGSGSWGCCRFRLAHFKGHLPTRAFRTFLAPRTYGVHLAPLITSASFIHFALLLFLSFGLFDPRLKRLNPESLTWYRPSSRTSWSHPPTPVAAASELPRRPPPKAGDPRWWLQKEGLWLVTLPNGHVMSQCFSSSPKGPSEQRLRGEEPPAAVAELHGQPSRPASR